MTPGTAAAKYVQWIQSENLAQENYTNALIAADQAKHEGNQQLGLTGINIAKRDYAKNLAQAAYDRDTDEADARADEIASMLTPTKQYLDDVANTQRSYNIALAGAKATKAQNIATGTDADLAEQQYQEQLAGIEDWYDSTLDSEDEEWSDKQEAAVGAWYGRVATDQHTANTTVIDANQSVAHSDNATLNWHEHAANALLLQITDLSGAIRRAFVESQASTWIAALQSAASLHPSPWFTFNLAAAIHDYDDRLAPVADSQQALDHSVAQAETARLDTQADDRAQAQDEAADDSAADKHSDADAALQSAQAAAPGIAAAAAAQLPKLESQARADSLAHPGPAATAQQLAALASDPPAGASPTNSELVAAPEDAIPPAANQNGGEQPPGSKLDGQAYARIFVQLGRAARLRDWYELEKQKYLAGGRPNIPHKPEGAADAPQPGDELIPVTLEWIQNLGFKFLNLSHKLEAPLIALELGYRVNKIDEELKPLQAANLESTLAYLKDFRATNRTDAWPYGGGAAIGSKIHDLETKLKRRDELVTERQKIERFFADSELNTLPVPILRHPYGGEYAGLVVDIAGKGLEAAKDAAGRSFYLGDQAPGGLQASGNRPAQPFLARRVGC